MSTPSPPLSPNALYDVDHTPDPAPHDSSPLFTLTRTVAIIKTHALKHRFDIERRIQEANFEVGFPNLDSSGVRSSSVAGLLLIDCQRKANGIRY
jgi:hypothetical protein